MATGKQFFKNKDGMVLKGVTIIAFGLVALFYPGEAIHALMPAFGMLVTINGLATLFNSFWFCKSGSRWRKVLLRNGSIELLVGAAALWCTAFSIPVFLELIAVWAIFSGSIHINRFVRLKVRSTGRYIMVFLGIFSVIFGTFVLINLQVSIVSFTYEITVFALITGCCMIYAFFRLREMQQYLKNTPKKLHSPKTTVYYDRSY